MGLKENFIKKCMLDLIILQGASRINVSRDLWLNGYYWGPQAEIYQEIYAGSDNTGGGPTSSISPWAYRKLVAQRPIMS